MGDADDSDRHLLARLRAGRDAQALAEIARRYGGLVHGVCRRRAGDARAATLTPQVFTALLECPTEVTGALPQWLHAAALARSGPGGAPPPADAEAEWAALAGRVDAALAALAPIARLHLLLAYAFLPARGQAAAVRADLGDCRAAAVGAAVAALAAGLGVPAAGLADLLDRNLITLPPPAVAATVATLALRSLEPSPTAGGARRRIPTSYAIAIAGIAWVVIVTIALYVLGPKAADRRHSHEPVPALQP